jgi:hypothetical protein
MCRAKIDVDLLVAPAEQILEMVARTGSLTAEDERHRRFPPLPRRHPDGHGALSKSLDAEHEPERSYYVGCRYRGHRYACTSVRPAIRRDDG